jgi:RNA polymerase sigma-70 factor, ECF subfamily
MDASSADLLARWRQGDEAAAAALYARYAKRLRALARRRLSPQLARLVDADDIVQSAWGSFFADARAGRYVLRDDADPWRLLASITVHKLQRQAERQRTAKRSGRREQHFGGESSLNALTAPGHRAMATPSAVVALAESVEQALDGLDLLQRRMVHLRLDGNSLSEVATAVCRSERTVRRVLEQVKQRLHEMGLRAGDIAPL